MNKQVLITGAGPTGLTLALWLETPTGLADSNRDIDHFRRPPA